MYLAMLKIENFRCFGEGNKCFETHLNPGLTALVGENDSGKSAVIDAIRYALGTSDQEWNRIEDTDFNVDAEKREIRIICQFQNLTKFEKRVFLEHLTYGTGEDKDCCLYIHWTAIESGKLRRGRPYRHTEVRSGQNGDGPQIDPRVRDFLHATYLRPLRDAEQSLSAGRGSRLAQVLQQSNAVKEGDIHDLNTPLNVSGHNLSILGVAKLMEKLLETQKGIVGAEKGVTERLEKLALKNDALTSKMSISGDGLLEETQIRQLLEKVALSLSGKGKSGLGSNNLLFMACELLLLGSDEGCKLLLIEEPEAHLHAQRQLQAIKHLQDQNSEKDVQVIITTHSPNLASAIDLDNIILIHNRKSFPMADGKTALAKSDYKFLQRFLDSTKANLFFAKGVMIVEGPAESILLPTIARLIGRDFTEYGISVVNVGGVGLRRYARIFQRKEVVDGEQGHLQIPVACVTDMDVLPNCAPVIIGNVKEGEAWPSIEGKNARKWRGKQDFDGETKLTKRRESIEEKASGQTVKTFVSDEWTLEYDLALGVKDKDGKFTGGLCEDVYVAARLAKADESINNGTKTVDEIKERALADFEILKKSLAEQNACSVEEVLASYVYRFFAVDNVSKSIAAQYLSERLESKISNKEISPEELQKRLPKYLVEAIKYVAPVPKDKQQEVVVEGGDGANAG